MVLLTTPLDASDSWSLTSFAHGMAAAVLLFGLAAVQLSNAIAIHELRVCVSGLGLYSFPGFGFFVSPLLELVRPDDA